MVCHSCKEMNSHPLGVYISKSFTDRNTPDLDRESLATQEEDESVPEKGYLASFCLHLYLSIFIPDPFVRIYALMSCLLNSCARLKNGKVFADTSSVLSSRSQTDGR